MDREQVERDLEQFAASVRVMGGPSLTIEEVRRREELRDVVLELAASGPQIDFGEDEADLMREIERFNSGELIQRRRIRAAARARKARRGWR